MIGTIECANRFGRSARRTSGPVPVSTQPSQKTRPTPTQNASRPRFISRFSAQSFSATNALPWRNRIQGGESANESNAVLPNSTAPTATRPGRTGTVSRLASGLRTSSRPSRRCHTDIRATRPE